MCTGIQIRTRNGAPFYGRTMEFASELESEILVIKQGTLFTGTGPIADKGGATWSAKYPITGLNANGLDRIIDGINSAGLCIGAFFFKDYAGYQEVLPGLAHRSVCSVDLPTYLLSLCANIEEVKNELRNIFVNKAAPSVGSSGSSGSAPLPLHYNIHDAQGKAIVVEYIDGLLHIHENYSGALTNAPEFAWHTTNLKNYVNLSAIDSNPWELRNTSEQTTLSVTATGQGSGFLGLPGDYTPPSRFIRAVAYSSYAQQMETHQEAMLQVFHILDNFDIPKGSIIQQNPDGSESLEYTQWTVASDLIEKKFYFHTVNDRAIRMVDLANWKFGDQNITRIFVNHGPTIVNLAEN